jgi:hypothetical protein
MPGFRITSEASIKLIWPKISPVMRSGNLRLRYSVHVVSFIRFAEGCFVRPEADRRSDTGHRVIDAKRIVHHQRQYAQARAPDPFSTPL